MSRPRAPGQAAHLESELDHGLAHTPANISSKGFGDLDVQARKAEATGMPQLPTAGHVQGTTTACLGGDPRDQAALQDLLPLWPGNRKPGHLPTTQEGGRQGVRAPDIAAASWPTAHAVGHGGHRHPRPDASARPPGLQPPHRLPPPCA